MSVSAAAIALGVMGTVAAAPTSSPKSTAKPGTNPSANPSASKRPAEPQLSKWQQHVQQMLRVSAPGDEYFGRMKMSYLGINNTFRDDLIRAGAYTTDSKIVNRIELADDALTAWARKYPNDPQLARSYFLAFQMYRKVWVRTYQDKAWIYAHRVIQKWPSSFFGKALKKDLAIGFTEHYFATPDICAPVEPEPSSSPNRRATPTPSPSPSPSPTPTPTPARGQPKRDILPVPCITPQTPTPIPSLSPIPTGSALPSPLPSGSLRPSPLPSSRVLPLLSPSPEPTPHHHPK